MDWFLAKCGQEVHDWWQSKSQGSSGFDLIELTTAPANACFQYHSCNKFIHALVNEVVSGIVVVVGMELHEYVAAVHDDIAIVSSAVTGRIEVAKESSQRQRIGQE